MIKNRQRRRPQAKARLWAAGAVILALLAIGLLAWSMSGTDGRPARASSSGEPEKTPAPAVEKDSGAGFAEQEIENSGKAQFLAEDRAAAAVEPGHGPEGKAPSEPGNEQPAQRQEAQAEAGDEPPADGESGQAADPEAADAEAADAEAIGTTQRVKANYEPQLRALQASCEAKAAQLAEQIAGDWAVLASSDAEDIRTMYNKYADRLAQAEAECRSGWEQIAAAAQEELKQAGLEDTLTAAWRSQYEKARHEAQAKALARLEQIMAPGS